MKKLIRRILGEDFFYNNIAYIRQSISNCETFLDLGCGSASPYIRYLHEAHHKATGVDLYADVSTAYDTIIRDDVMNFVTSLPDNSFDAVTGFDIVEHFEKADAQKLVKHMQRIAKKTVVIVTPNGFWPGMIDGPGQDHLCGFSVQELQDDGFRIYGSGGLALLRSRKHSYMKGFSRSHVTLPFQIFFFNLTQMLARSNPSMAYGLCAIKTIEDDK